MGRYTPTVRFETEFDGDKVVVVFKRMQSSHSMRLAPFLRPLPDGEKGIEPLTVEDKIGLFKESLPILRECIVEITGSKQPDGTENTVDTILSQEYFGPLVTKIMEQLMSASRLQEDDAKKSDAPSAAPPSAVKSEPQSA